MAAAIDFARSFLWWRVDVDKVPPGTITVPPPYPVNNARMPLDCLCTVRDGESGATRVFSLGDACKTEAVGAPRDIWPQPNADFIQVLSDDGWSLGIKTYERVGRQIPFHLAERGLQPERQVARVDEVYEWARTDVTRVAATPLTTPPAAVAAILDNARLTARTAWEEGRYRVELEYPVKTVNANEVDDVFQPDTGPVLVPDLSVEPPDLLAGLQLGFIAFNRWQGAELLLRVPVEVGEGLSTWHYAEPRRIESRNELLRLS